MKVVSAKQAKKLGTRKKRVLNVDELNAYKSAYGKPLKAKDYMVLVGVPAIGFSMLSFIFLYNVWVSFAFGVMGIFYGIKFYLPKSIARNYQMNAHAQRNKFLNNMTQILTDESKTVSQALSSVYLRSQGEFKDDLAKLQAGLFGVDTEQISQAIAVLIKKYESDIIFVQYMEQIETALLEGRANIDSLKDLKTYHNDIKKKQVQYEKKKQMHLSHMKLLLLAIVFLITVVVISFGFSLYIEAFAHKPVGWVTCGLVLFLYGVFFKQFSTYLFDDSVTEVSI